MSAEYTPERIGATLAEAKRLLLPPNIISSDDQNRRALVEIVEQLRVENAKLIAERTERCENCECNAFPAKGLRHEGCDGAFCFHGYCQECGATLIEEPVQ